MDDVSRILRRKWMSMIVFEKFIEVNSSRRKGRENTSKGNLLN